MANRLEQLISGRPWIAPSMLKCDFGDLAGELAALEKATQTPLIHFDVMDAHFVPNLSYGAMLIESVRSRTDLPFEAHLMISEPARYLDDYIKAGCDIITFHIEAVPEPTELLQKIKSHGRMAGLALNPGTPVASIEPFLADCDLVLVMSVEPGFGGQQFMPVALEKIQAIREKLKPEQLLSVDGGIGLDTIAPCANSGADTFVCGSSIFNEADYPTAMDGLLTAISAGKR
ncbi:ribulose-phosphate 3-epimerase [Rubinisphaera sp. JC750]|uniref:ribulose-phosphate 3-epimerase n=1 Tax=Rubinisphaera sp. JC750 TaxID=2898658 RepID=UPI001EFFC419|nr:ribulose-phosphate 3-epimerase [Rubinisphaera sp. JC750]